MALATIDRDDCRDTSPRSFTHLSDTELDALIVFINSEFTVYEIVSAEAVVASTIAASMKLADQPSDYQKSIMVAMTRYSAWVDKTADQRSEGLGQRYGFLWDETATSKGQGPLETQLIGMLLRHGVTHAAMEARRPPPAASSRTAMRGDDRPLTTDPEYPETDFRQHRKVADDIPVDR